MELVLWHLDVFDEDGPEVIASEQQHLHDGEPLLWCRSRPGLLQQGLNHFQADMKILKLSHALHAVMHTFIEYSLLEKNLTEHGKIAFNLLFITK